VIGGASFPAPVGTVTLSWPLAAAEVTAEGIDVVMRRSVFRWLATGGMSDSPGPPGTSRFAWGDLSNVSQGPRSVVLRSKSGYGCRFVVLRASNLLPLIDAIRAHHIPIEQVASTWRWVWNFK
jgi:hypothetical protein